MAQIAFGPVRAYKGAVGRMVSADLDHDGDIDLVTGDVGSTRVSVLLNNGDGTFASPVDYSIPSGTRALIAADLNGDTHVDLVLARAGLFPTGDGIISVLLNNGFGIFGSVLDFSLMVSPIAGQQLTPLSLAAGDFDKDGDIDLAAATVLLNQLDQPGYFSIILNVGNDVLGQPLFDPSVNVDATQSFSRDIVADDFDNDTDVDLAIVSSLSNRTNSVSVILSNGDGTFGLVRNERLTGTATAAARLIVGDINGDTFVDFITINAQHTYSVLLNLDGGTDPAKAGLFADQGQFPLGSQALPATDSPGGGAALRDLDGDTDLDLIVSLVGDSGPGSLAVFVNPGTGVFATEITLGPCFNYGSLAAEDFDGDGDVDVTSGDVSKQRTLVLLNELIPAVPPISDPADADGDGVLDCDDGCPLDPAKSVPGVCGCAGSFIASSCDDGDACTTGDVCSSGVCVSGSPTNCNDSNVCTDDSCDSITGCLNTPVLDRLCDDENVCTQTDTCNALGECAGSIGLNCNDSNECTDDSCDPATGCSNVANTAPCDDNDACTTGDVCSSSVCVSGSQTNCNDNNACTDDSCNSISGCLNTPVAGRACDDSDVCTLSDTCDALGSCVGAELNCNDTNECTDDSCDSVAGCLNTPVVGRACEDGDACTLAGTCDALGDCIGSAGLNCNDTNECTDDSCDTATGCLNTPVAGRACDDSDVCTLSDTCDALGSCVGAGLLDCNDTNECTDDSCDALLGCQNLSVPGRACNDGRDCTTNDVCDSAGDCVGDGSACAQVPTVSSWGLMIMILLLFIAGTLLLTNIRNTTTTE